MSTIIKANELNRGVRGEAFNFDDMTASAKRYLDEVRAEAAQIVAAAKEKAAAIRERAEVEGQRAGEKKLEQIVQQQLAQQLATVLPALRKAIQEIQYAKQAWLAHWEKTGVHVAAAIASRLIRRELSQTPDIPLALIREALELAVGSAQLRVHVNPADHKVLAPQIEILMAELTPLGSAELVADPEIGHGGCRVETRFGVIDQQFETQLARIEEELT